MPEAATDTATLDPNPAVGLGLDDSKMKAVTSTLADAKRQEIGANEKVYGQLDSLTSKAIPKLEKLSENAGVEAEKMKPWNEAEESKKRDANSALASSSSSSKETKFAKNSVTKVLIICII